MFGSRFCLNALENLARDDSTYCDQWQFNHLCQLPNRKLKQIGRKLEELGNGGGEQPVKLGPGAVDRGSLVGEACKRLQRLESDKVGW